MKKRNTPAKQMIRDLLTNSVTALSQDMVEGQLKGSIDRVTIYRVLNSFCEDGLVHRVVSDEGKTYFALCIGCKGNHHRHEHAHFRCLNCQTVECLPTIVKAKLPEGYSMTQMNFWISGYCKACASMAAA